MAAKEKENLTAAEDKDTKEDEKSMEENDETEENMDDAMEYANEINLDSDESDMEQGANDLEVRFLLENIYKFKVDNHETDENKDPNNQVENDKDDEEWKENPVIFSFFNTLFYFRRKLKKTKSMEIINHNLRRNLN